MTNDTDSVQESFNNPPRPQRTFGWFTVFSLLGIGAVLVAILLPAMNRGGREPARRTQCMSNLRNIAQAVLQYQDVYRVFPPALTVDADGRPLHSWRVLILPYLDQQALYDTIDLTRPWDDPANLKAGEKIPEIYRCPSSNRPPGHTTYLASAAENGCFPPGKSRSLSDVTDGPGETLMVIEVPLMQSVPWMSPQDADGALILSLGRDSQLAHSSVLNAAFCNGTIRPLSVDLPAAVRLALISIAGNDKLREQDW